MTTRILIAVFVWFILGCPATTGFGQKIPQVAEWLDRETPILLEVHDVKSTFDQLKRLPILQLQNWNDLVKQLEEGESPIVQSERVDLFLRSVEELNYLIPDADEFHIAVHDLDQKIYSVFLKADDSTLNEIESHLVTLIGCAALGRADSEDLEALDLNTLNRVTLTRRMGELRRFEDWLIYSNNESFLKRVIGWENMDPDNRPSTWPASPRLESIRLSGDSNTPFRVENSLPEAFQPAPDVEAPEVSADSKFRSLADNRAYQTIRKRSERISPDQDSIAIYLKPEKLNAFFPHYSATEWRGYFNHELPAAGINVLFSETSDSPDEPMLIADATILFTKPRQGRSLMIKHYKPVTIPYLTVKPVELMALARDEEAFSEESLRCYDLMFGEDAAKSWLDNRFSSDNRDYFEDAIPKRKNYLELKFAEDSEIPGLRMLRMEEINDRDAMKRYFDGMIKEALESYESAMVSESEDDVEIWRLPDEIAEQNIGKQESNTHFLHADNFTLDSYILGKDWYVEGEWPHTMVQLDHLENHVGEKVDHGEPIRKLIKDLLRRTDDSDPYTVKYYEPESWTQKIDQTAQPYNLPRHELNFRVVNSDGGAEYASSKKMREQLNKHLELEAAKRTWKNNAAKKIAELFGRQLYLYTQSEDEIRVVLGCYPMPPESNGDPN